MRNTHTCPKCAGTHIAIAPQFRFSDPDYVNRLVPLCPITIGVPGWIGGKIEVGHFQVYICVQCGYSELYAEQLKGLAELARKYPEQLQIVRKS
jgi:predicted nucleic-acid-binding Zn-ribbon protein